LKIRELTGRPWNKTVSIEFWSNLDSDPESGFGFFTDTCVIYRHSALSRWCHACCWHCNHCYQQSSEQLNHQIRWSQIYLV